MKVTSVKELAAAIEAGEQNIEVEGTISGSPSITLPEGATLSGGTLEFTAKGVRLTKNNTLRDVTITTTDYEVAVYNSTSLADAGTFRLNNVTTVGQVYIIAEGELKKVRVEADHVFVKSADVRGRVEQPHGYGVDVLQGGFTLWNRNPDPDSLFTATLRGISAGTEETPVRGSGIFVDGYTDREGKLAGGKFTADLIETDTIVTDGGIVQGTPDKITGGVFVLGGAIVDRVENNGPVTTHGPNDMVLDLWGRTPEWVANEAITSTGASGIGFVNFGDMGHLEINAPIVTSGLGARGFNVYDGSVQSAKFQSITTHGDGAIGIQVSKPMGSLEVTGDVRTTGAEGLSLVKGVQMPLQAIGVSIKPGGELTALTIGGVVATEGDHLVSFEVLEGAAVNALSVGGIEAHGTGSVTTKIEGTIPAGTL
ncbi:MAG: hypothetical protein PT944_04085 [Actinomycetaceae bacterium]|nr:hypothetical protein [Arcanobacterium sp.]MDD7687083.1 hypothetical protein [Actinomycetaceae bacterium]MDY5273251.1 hypothetical protein [Arcanobacterium sp.]